jgi:hypothetical protein
MKKYEVKKPNELQKSNKAIFMGIVIGSMLLASIGVLNAPQNANAQESDAGASSLAGPQGAGQIIGPMSPYAPGHTNDPSAENPGSQGLDASLIGPNLKCVIGQPPCK